MKRRSPGVFVFCLLAAGAFAQDQPAQTESSPIGSCSGHKDLSKYTIRSSRVSDPFSTLRWRRLDAATLAAVKALEGQPYSFSAVNAVSQKIEAKAWLPDTPDIRAEFNYSDIALENCQDYKLDVVFFVFSARISSTLSSLLEWRTKQIEAPAEAAGVSKTSAPVQFAPEAGFDPAMRFIGGGTTLLAFPPSAPFRSLEIKGTGSAASRTLSGALNGGYDSSAGWLGHAEWRLDFSNIVMPAAVDRQLVQSRVAGQFSGTTRPLRGAVLRFGGMAEDGTFQSAFAAAELSAQTLSNTHYTSAKLYGGITGNWRRQAFAASYGIELGSRGNTFHGSWRRQIGDVSHQIWLPFGNHRLFELEQRLTAGGLQTLGAVPVAERFFGGNHETPFTAGSGWTIRANPVVRSIPANRLYLTAAGAGGDQFVSYNSTTAITVWGMPVVPKELTADGEFQKLLNGAITSQSSVLQNYYETKDPHFQAIRDKLPEVAAKLERIRAAEVTAQTSAPASLNPDFQACSDALASSVTAVQNALNDDPVSALGWVPELLPDGIDPLADVVSACGAALVAKLAGASILAPGLESGTKELDGMAAMIGTSFQAIDDKQAGKKAAKDVSYVKRTLDVITKQMTITSISPVFVFDAARIGPTAAGPYSGNRYGVGGGIRFSLVGTVNFTLGYAANPHSRPNEGTGAFFFSLTTRNLFD